MSNVQNIWKKFTKSLAAGELWTTNVHIKTFAMLAGASAGISVSFDNHDGSDLPPGMTIATSDPGEYINLISVTNNTGGAVTVTFAVSEYFINNNSLTVSQAIEVLSGSSVVSGSQNTGGAAAVAINAAAGQNSIHICNTHASDNLYVGAANVGNDAAPVGAVVPPGGAYICDISGTVYIRRGAANDITASFNQVVG